MGNHERMPRGLPAKEDTAYKAEYLCAVYHPCAAQHPCVPSYVAHRRSLPHALANVPLAGELLDNRLVRRVASRGAKLCSDVGTDGKRSRDWHRRTTGGPCGSVQGCASVS